MSESFYYDLHIHSCLSPCADDDMTPGNIVGMAKVKGLDVIALTDHNTCKNCGAAMAAGEKLGVLVLPGMELCTAEDIHVVCLFEELAGAEGFAEEVYRWLPDIPNRPDIFGEQQIMDECDQLIGTEPRLLLNAAAIGVDEAVATAARFGGAAFPAHIDRSANGIMGILGGIPPEAGFTSAELSAGCDEAAFFRDNPQLRGYQILKNSDAHYLWTINECQNSIDLPQMSTGALIALIKRQKVI
jgi:PHP family Zn ribbon phosphoesterase